MIKKTNTAKSKAGSVKITLKKSGIARLPAHRATLKGLGLTRLHQSVVRENTPEIQGMINKVSYLVSVEQN